MAALRSSGWLPEAPRPFPSPGFGVWGLKATDKRARPRKTLPVVAGRLEFSNLRCPIFLTFVR